MLRIWCVSSFILISVSSARSAERPTDNDRPAKAFLECILNHNARALEVLHARQDQLELALFEQRLLEQLENQILDQTKYLNLRDAAVQTLENKLAKDGWVLPANWQEKLEDFDTRPEFQNMSTVPDRSLPLLFFWNRKLLAIDVEVVDQAYCALVKQKRKEGPTHERRNHPKYLTGKIIRQFVEPGDHSLFFDNKQDIERSHKDGQAANFLTTEAPTILELEWSNSVIQWWNTCTRSAYGYLSWLW